MTYIGWDNREYEDPEMAAMREGIVRAEPCHECRWDGPCWQDPRNCDCECHLERKGSVEGSDPGRNPETGPIPARSG